VIAGGFSTQAESGNWAQKIRSDLELDEVRTTRITPGARMLDLAALRSSEGVPDE
jgi:hypothetical protein